MSSLLAFAMDDLDRRLLVELERDASISNQALAERVFSSAPTCLRRVRRLRESGVIRDVVAILEPEAVGRTLTAIVEVTLDVQSAEASAAFAARADADDAVTQCYRVSGGPDFIVVVMAADMPAYQQVVGRLFSAAGNVRNIRTFFSVTRTKFQTRLMSSAPA